MARALTTAPSVLTASHRNRGNASSDGLCCAEIQARRGPPSTPPHHPTHPSALHACARVYQVAKLESGLTRGHRVWLRTGSKSASQERNMTASLWRLSGDDVCPSPYSREDPQTGGSISLPGAPVPSVPGCCSFAPAYLCPRAGKGSALRMHFWHFTRRESSLLPSLSQSSPGVQCLPR